ncbi:MAG: hypothetical protein HYV27_07590 [Candidatus Hydrogenedentes bacterium]|nr:hypothetical protein [Candidatus Hydrogenedentota bacterium]
MSDHPLFDRALRALFVAMAVGIAWGIRGDFGGVLGAMYPGAVLGLGFAFVSGQESILRRMPVLALLGGLLIGMGGDMSYGILHGYAKSDTFINYSYGFFTLLLQGGCWGLFGGAAIGMALDDRRPVWWEAALAAVGVVVSGLLLEQFVEHVLHFQVDSRGNSIVPFIGGGIVFVIWMALRGYGYGLRGAFFGFLGFGGGMFFGRFLSNWSHQIPVTMNNWNIMEIGCGFIGGLIFTCGMIGLPDRSEDPPEGASPMSIVGMIYAVALIPLMHLVLLVRPAEKKAEWIGTLTQYGRSDASALADQTQTWLLLVTLMGFVIFGIWYWWHAAERNDLGWQPVMGLTLLMILFHNIHSLFFYQPRVEHSFKTPVIFWLFFILMGVYAAWRREHEAIDTDDEDAWLPMVARWAGALVIVFTATLVLAGAINGEETMKSAEMRWPTWSFRDGTPPPR